ncbi:MAG TPA: helix-turn-helix domain-containing protein [Candidatus Dormibacteraeota bacterium]|nr:helix-turn-helix domain-containing protein [Candidatus Dormibacteraeota bacterium]
MQRAGSLSVVEAAERIAQLCLHTAIAQTNQSTKGAMLLRRARADGDRRGAPMPEWRGRARAWESHTVMTVAQVAAAIGIPPEKVRRLLRAGVLFGINFGGAIGWRVFRDSLVELGLDNVAAALDLPPEISP